MSISSSSQDADLYEDAVRHYSMGRIRQAAEIAGELSARRYMLGDALLGLVHEYGGDGIQVDLDRAVMHYRRAAYDLRDGLSWIHLASALRKSGDVDGAAKALSEANEYSWTGDHHLAFARYEHQRGNPASARHHYLAAAVRVRFGGFFGLASVLRETGRHCRALGVDVIRLCLGPAAWMLFGRVPSRGGKISLPRVGLRLAVILLATLGILLIRYP